jgi:hypothetical protein
MTLSDGLAQTRTLVGLAGALRGMSTANMLFVQYPVADDPADRARVIVDQDAAHTLNVALQNDQKTSLSDSTTGRASEESPTAGSSATSAPATGSSGGSAAPSSGSSSASSSAGGAATSAATPTSTPLPSSITGQSASEQTCSVGND